MGWAVIFSKGFCCPWLGWLLTGWLAGRLADWLAGWLVPGWMVGWLADWLAGRLAVLLAG